MTNSDSKNNRAENEIRQINDNFDTMKKMSDYVGAIIRLSFLFVIMINIAFACFLASHFMLSILLLLIFIMLLIYTIGYGLVIFNFTFLFLCEFLYNEVKFVNISREISSNISIIIVPSLFLFLVMAIIVITVKFSPNIWG